MFRNEKLEMKVGLFIGIGIFLMFLIVFSIKDVSMLGKGYEFNVTFDFVNGVTESSPVRLSGVRVGEINKVDLFYDAEAGRTRVKLLLWLRGNVNIEEDAVARINSLGLLGEQYVEITPGISKVFVKPGGKIIGHNPVHVGEQMEKVKDIMDSFAVISGRIAKGEGTIGKLMTDDTLYNDLEVIFGRLKNGEGTIGKLLVEEKIYNDMEGFVADIKANPWKLLHKTEEKPREEAQPVKKGTSFSHK